MVRHLDANWSTWLYPGLPCRCRFSKITIDEGSPNAGSDALDIIVHGIGAQIVTNLQTVISRELASRDAGVITIGAFDSGTKHNIISERAHLHFTLRSLNPRVREQLLSALKRIAIGTAKTALVMTKCQKSSLALKHSLPYLTIKN